jgi:hypothetical protein
VRLARHRAGQIIAFPEVGDCIIATSAALRELFRPPNGHADFGVEGHSALPATQCNADQNKFRRLPVAPIFHSVDENSRLNRPNLPSCLIHFLSKDTATFEEGLPHLNL